MANEKAEWGVVDGQPFHEGRIKKNRFNDLDHDHRRHTW